MRVGAEGRVTCLRSYDGVVTVSVGPLSRVLIAHCRMVAEVRPEGSTVRLMPSPSPGRGRVLFAAYDADGTALRDVPVALVSADPSIVVVDGRIQTIDFTVGTHEVTVTLMDSEHNELDPSVSTSATLTVQ